jgi:hypothetical protein
VGSVPGDLPSPAGGAAVGPLRQWGRAEPARRPRFLICVGPRGDCGADRFALLAPEQPSLIRLGAADLAPAPQAPSGVFVLRAFSFRGERAVLPDLYALEAALRGFADGRLPADQ